MRTTKKLFCEMQKQKRARHNSREILGFSNHEKTGLAKRRKTEVADAVGCLLMGDSTFARDVALAQSRAPGVGKSKAVVLPETHELGITLVSFF